MASSLSSDCIHLGCQPVVGEVYIVPLECHLIPLIDCSCLTSSTCLTSTANCMLRDIPTCTQIIIKFGNERNLLV